MNLCSKILFGGVLVHEVLREVLHAGATKNRYQNKDWATYRTEPGRRASNWLGAVAPSRILVVWG